MVGSQRVLCVPLAEVVGYMPYQIQKSKTPGWQLAVGGWQYHRLLNLLILKALDDGYLGWLAV